MKKIVLAILILTLSHSFAFSQSSKQTDIIPLDPAVKYGKLANGLTYYVRKNDNPKDKIEMRLIVNAGGFFEDSDQLEMAHLTEHMAFEGTRNFPKDSMLNYAAKKGIRFGNEITASTARTSTQYILRIPSNDTELLTNSFRILRDWAQEISFDPERIEAQRNVVLAEKRMRGSIPSLAELGSQVLNNENYSSNRLIKIKESLHNLLNKYPSLIRFYKDWYRPDLEAIIIVGDIDVESIENKIKTLFSELKQPSYPRKAVDFTAAWQGKMTSKNRLIKIENEQAEIDISIFQKRKGGNTIRTGRDYSSYIMDELYNILMKGRLRELPRQYNSPLKVADNRIDRNIIGDFSGIDALVTFIRLSKDADMQAALKTVVAEVNRVKQHGFTADELGRAKSTFLKNTKQIDKTSSAVLVKNYIDHFAFGKAAPSPEYEFDLIDRLINEINAETITKYAKDWISSEGNIDIAILSQKSDQQRLPGESSVFKWFSDARKIRTQPFNVSTQTSDSLLYAKDIKEESGKFNYTETRMPYDTSIIKLELMNGVKVILKPSAASSSSKRNNRINLLGVSDGGSSMYNSKDSLIAEYATYIIMNNGLGHFNKFQLEDYLNEKQVSVHPSIDVQSKQIVGSCTAQELETMFQMVYLYFTAPRKDSIAFIDWKSRMKAELGNRKGFNDVFEDSINFLTNNIRPILLSQLNEIRFDKAWTIYQQLFSGGVDFTFFLTGDFDYRMMQQLIFRYLGTLPEGKKINNTSRKETDISVGAITKTLYIGSKGKALVQLYYPWKSTSTSSIKNSLIQDVLKEVVGFILFDRLRTKEGGTYTPDITANRRELSNNESRYRLGVRFDCEPDNLENMIASTLEELQVLNKTGPDQTTLLKAIGKITQILKRSSEIDLSPRGLRQIYLTGQKPMLIAEKLKVLNDITVEDIKTAAKYYINEGSLQRFVMLPAINK